MCIYTYIQRVQDFHALWSFLEGPIRRIIAYWGLCWALCVWEPELEEVEKL